MKNRQRKWKIKSASAGLELEVTDGGVNGAVVRHLLSGGAVDRDGRLSVGDYVVGFNGENLRNYNSAQVKAAVRRVSLGGNIKKVR